MDKAIIVGGYNFLAFNLCEALLNSGSQVYCVQLGEEDQEYLEQKKLLVGRNANFSVVPVERMPTLLTSENEDVPILVISLYDCFLDHTETKALSQTRKLINTQKLAFQVLFLLPIQIIAMEASDFWEMKRSTYDLFLNELRKMRITSKSIFLPTVYGPWQPDTFVFQQAFLLKANQLENQAISLHNYEWTGDAIYVKDAVCEIIRLASVQYDSCCLFSSSCPDHWKNCAEYLSINPGLIIGRNDTIQFGQEMPVEKVIVCESIGYKDALKTQELHLQRLLEDFF